MRSSIELSLVSHTNAGKTTLARTLLGRDVGEIRDAPHVTEVAESHLLIATAEGDVLRLWDTPGFGDSVRLARRLRTADHPIGWMLREVWDRLRDRPLWCSQQAVRAVRESADVVLYLVNAAEDPQDAGYVLPELQILDWIGKPVLVLLNQVGPPRPASCERAEQDRWRAHAAPHAVVRDVLTLDAFARCWVHEGELLDRIAGLLPGEKRAAAGRLVAAWQLRSRTRFEQAMDVLARQVMAAVRDREPIGSAAGLQGARRVLKALGLGKGAAEGARERAMAALAQRLDTRIRAATDQLIALHQLEGNASAVVLERMREQYAMTEGFSEGRAAALGGLVSGALTGLAADLAAGGFTLGAGLLTGAIVGALGGAGAARGVNVLRGTDHPFAAWSPGFVDRLVRAALLRYLAVAHFGRGRGEYSEGEAPAFWREEVARAVEARLPAYGALVEKSRATQGGGEATESLRLLLGDTALEILDRLYPGALSPGSDRDVRRAAS